MADVLIQKVLGDRKVSQIRFPALLGIADVRVPLGVGPGFACLKTGKPVLLQGMEQRGSRPQRALLVAEVSTKARCRLQR